MFLLRFDKRISRLQVQIFTAATPNCWANSLKANSKTVRMEAKFSAVLRNLKETT
jgi:hypothetical protein